MSKDTKKTSYKVVAYRLDGSLYKIYSNAKEASIKMHAHPRLIDKCLREHNYTALKYMWRKYEEDKIPHQIEPLERGFTSNKARRIYEVNEFDEVLCEYSSIKEASVKLGIDSHSIRDVLNNKAKQCKGHYFKYVHQESIELDKEKKYQMKPRRVIQYSLDGKYIKQYRSIYLAAKELKKSPQGIRDCINHKYQSAYGYKWKEKK